ncbi:hypothetical protein NC653_034348 [Populus alba x Populus x berolinensis]|uniref:Uncharacterized protein n=2 Tax=Populus TaxID=3689 RepID=A0A4U5R2E2_POPAL|nr:hypothetical protein NC653_034348 [Populus alba x Populus x berolinensis]TKS17371.1 hypothetical protein D5086_0000014550 [Populus alba]
MDGYNNHPPAQDSTIGGQSLALKGGAAGSLLFLLAFIIYVFLKRCDCTIIFKDFKDEVMFDVSVKNDLFSSFAMRKWQFEEASTLMRSGLHQGRNLCEWKVAINFTESVQISRKSIILGALPAGVKAHVHKQFSENENADLITLPPELTPFLARTIIEDPDGIDMLYLNSWLGLNLPGLDTNHRSLKPFKQAITDPYSKVRALVRLSREDIKNLRKRVLCQIEKLHLDTETRPMHLSSFLLAYAYVFVCVFKAKGLERDDKVVLGLTADCMALPILGVTKSL